MPYWNRKNFHENTWNKRYHCNVNTFGIFLQDFLLLQRKRWKHLNWIFHNHVATTQLTLGFPRDVDIWVSYKTKQRITKSRTLLLNRRKRNTHTNTHTHSRHSSNEILLFKYQPNVPQFLQPYNEIRETSTFTCLENRTGEGATNHSQYRQYSWQHHIVEVGHLWVVRCWNFSQADAKTPNTGAQRR